jgi:hypothetical protein
MTGLSRLRSWTLLSLGFCPNPGEKIRAFHLGPLQGYANRRFFEFVVPIAVRLLQRERTGLEGKIIHRDRHKKSILLDSPSLPFPLYVKHYVRHHLLQDLKDRFRGSQARKSFLLSLELEKRSIPTPPALAVLERWEKGIRREGFLICKGYAEGMPAARFLKTLHRQGSPEFQPALEAFGAFLRGVEQAGIRHGCLMSSVLTVPEAGQPPSYYLTDLEQLCTLGGINDHDCFRMVKDIRRELASVPREFLEAFSREGRRIGSRILQHPAMVVS